MKMNREFVDKYLQEEFNIRKEILDLATDSDEALSETFESIDIMAEYHQAKVLKAFQDVGVSDHHFNWTTGYGYDDMGRDAVEDVFAKIFGGETALVRPNIVNGTHAISLALQGLLKSGDRLIYATGKPYDSLHSVISELESNEIEYVEIPLDDRDEFDITKIKEAISKPTKGQQMIALQRSKGYSCRKSITVNQLRELAQFIDSFDNEIILMVDNCYCEFVDEESPCEVGMDICCGSLIKNPGGGLALTGGYLVGKSELIEKTAYRLTCPGIGGECGLTFGQNRTVLQGLFQAPRVTAGALKGAIFCGYMFDKLGFDVYPKVSDLRADIIQGIILPSVDYVMAFCKGVQSASPVDSNVTPVPAPMPGYEDEVIMAAGTFVQGASIELSADGPLREPFTVYFQGGLTFEHSKIGVMQAAEHVLSLQG